MSLISRMHIPFLYMERGKRPGSRYFLKVVLADDFAVLLLGLAWISPEPLLTAAMLFFFHLSLWCIYEIGYAENDRVAEKFEADPHLSEGYAPHLARVNFIHAGLWALLFAAPGLYLFDHLGVSGAESQTHTPATVMMTGLAWILALIGLRIAYRLFNHLDKHTRVWIYLLLQGFKTLPFLIMTPANMVAIAFFCAQATGRWHAYLMYRLTTAGWTPTIHQVRLLLLLFFVFAFGLEDWGADWPSGIQEWSQLGAMALFFSWRGRRHILRMFTEAHRIN